MAKLALNVLQIPSKNTVRSATMPTMPVSEQLCFGESGRLDKAKSPISLHLVKSLKEHLWVPKLFPRLFFWFTHL